MAKARFGGDKIGPNPTDRAKPGTKRSLLVEANGGPLAVVIAGANVHDTKLLEKTLAAVVVERPNHQELEQHLCSDKGYDNPTGRDAVERHQYTPHVRKIGEEKWNENQQKVHPARRWVVERTLGASHFCNEYKYSNAKLSFFRYHSETNLAFESQFEYPIFAKSPDM